MKLISVIMPVYNEKLYELKNSIKSIQNQTYSNFEMIIIDDNPKSMIIKLFLLKIASEDSRIKIIFNKKNLGSMLSANKAINISNGKYIARMDADDVANKNRLYKQLLFCVKYNLDFCTCRILPLIKNKLIDQVYYCKTQVNQQKMKHLISNIVLINDLVEGPTLFFRKNAVEKIGGYRPVLGEDCDLAIRMIVNRYKIGFLSLPLVYKRSRSNSLSSNNTNVLKIYKIMHLFTKYVKETNFNSILPLSRIYYVINNIGVKNYIYYKKFVVFSLRYKRRKSIYDLLQRYRWSCSSPLIFFRNIFVLKRKIFHKFLNIFE